MPWPCRTPPDEKLPRAVGKVPVCFVWPLAMRFTELIGGHSLCSGCGSDVTFRVRVELLTNVTVWPTLIVPDAGLTAPFAPIVMVAPLVPPLADGPFGLSPYPP